LRAADRFLFAHRVDEHAHQAREIFEILACPIAEQHQLPRRALHELDAYLAQVLPPATP